jgi:hypothetical protein
MVCLLPTLFRQRQSAAGGTSVQADNIVGPGGMRAQLEQTFKNSNVTDYQTFSQRSDVPMRYFGVASPTSTTIQIGGLAQPEAMVEIKEPDPRRRLLRQRPNHSPGTRRVKRDTIKQRRFRHHFKAA